MTTFLRLLADKDKAASLIGTCFALRAGILDSRIFQVPPESFRVVPGAPFAYWVSEEVRNKFKQFGSFESDGRFVKHGLTTGNDDRFLRAWWEVLFAKEWLPFAKGGNHSPYYADQKLLLKWIKEGAELRGGYQLSLIHI